MERFPVLMYHRVLSDRCPVPGGDADETRYAVTFDEFQWQLELLETTGHRAVSMKRVHDRLEAGECIPAEWVAVTFDDGNQSDYEHACSLLTRRGWDATFYVCGNRVDADGGLERRMLREMSDKGLHIGSHGMTHRFLPTLSEIDESRELETSRSLLTEITGVTVDHFAPPGGRYGARTRQILSRLGYVAMGTSDFGFNRSHGRRFSYRRIAVVNSTSRARFAQFVSARPLRLLPDYARANMLKVLKSVLGESGYSRLRSMTAGD